MIRGKHSNGYKNSSPTGVRMGWLFPFLCLAFHLVFTATAGPRPTTAPLGNGGFHLSVLPSPDWSIAGERIIIQAGITNVSRARLKFMETGGADDFDVVVLKDGKPATLTDFGKSLRSEGEVVTTVFQWHPAVDPGQTRWYSVDVSRRFDMTMPGIYVIRVSRRVPSVDNPNPIQLDNPDGQVVANDIKIELLSPHYSGGVTTQPAPDDGKLKR
jgi:hypothetical protein